MNKWNQNVLQTFDMEDTKRARPWATLQQIAIPIKRPTAHNFVVFREDDKCHNMTDT